MKKQNFIIAVILIVVVSLNFGKSIMKRDSLGLNLNSLFALTNANSETDPTLNCESVASSFESYYSGGKEYSCEFTYVCSGTRGTCMAGCALYLATSWKSYKNYLGYYSADSFSSEPSETSLASSNC